jgi:hypothetical protein
LYGEWNCIEKLVEMNGNQLKRKEKKGKEWISKKCQPCPEQSGNPDLDPLYKSTGH